MTAIDTQGVLELVREVGAGLCESFWRGQPADIRAADEQLRQALNAQYPSIAWADGALSEEYARHGEYWICDAVDGAMQFQRAMPGWSMALTLMREGVAVFALVYDAMHDEMFHALWRHGAWCNGQPMRVSEQATQQTIATRGLGPASLQLAYVAGGRLDAFWQRGNDGYRCIGGALLVREAGGQATQLDGQPYRLASSSIAAGGAAGLLLVASLG
ncbi:MULTISPECIES: inositol monophosphatase family protein [unclassified Duganella]|jgi:myo-inositol-1(or 4)-monophosphatase|uniref:inositol monophosphatase family protein n=1 Tax=unclassified Duganella TaxID=2636909 RepID=UPI0008873A21|nr:MULTISPECIES: inositol monophosphatase family protein [unclassified Duganella]SDH53860.1 myo-inositol-1(or 4)-monophosphatase [Duganella sp. OV458]SDK69029.1 myo-inositol-1(or 4)-monophosphatase [Duganella sp. OV510]